MKSPQVDNDALLQAMNLSAGHGHSKVLNDISLVIKPGEFIGLAGPNGSGKSTLLQTLTGHLPAQSGTVWLGKDDIAGLSRAEIARRLAFVPQRTEVAFAFTALEMVLMGRHAYCGYSTLDTPKDLEIAMEMLNRLQVTDLAHRHFTTLSGGEQQLVLMARALTQKSPLILLDEPLSGLDLRYQCTLMETLVSILEEDQRGILASFHDITLATRWCNRMILLKNCGILADGPPQSVITESNLELCYGISAKIYQLPDQLGLSIYVRSPPRSNDLKD